MRRRGVDVTRTSVRTPAFGLYVHALRHIVVVVVVVVIAVKKTVDFDVDERNEEDANVLKPAVISIRVY